MTQHKKEEPDNEPLAKPAEPDWEKYRREDAPWGYGPVGDGK